MSVDWLPMRLDLDLDPAVILIARRLETSELHVVGMLHKFWSWVNSQLSERDARSVTKKWIDDFIRVPGFAAALSEAGWLEDSGEGIRIPKYDRWNSKSAKQRLLTARRNAEYRQNVTLAASRKSGIRDARSVTNASPTERVRERVREEEEEDSLEPAEPGSKPADVVPILTIPCVGTGPKLWPLMPVKVVEWSEAYPGLDVVAEARKARQWAVDNPAKQKTFRGMPAFLNRWLARAQDQGRNNGVGIYSPKSNGVVKVDGITQVLEAARVKLQQQDAEHARRRIPEMG